MAFASLFAAHSKACAGVEGEQTAFIPVSVQAMAQHHRTYSALPYDDQRFSGDSGQGTDRTSSSLQSHPLSPLDEGLDRRSGEALRLDDSAESGGFQDLWEHEKATSAGYLPLKQYLMRWISALLSKRVRCIGVLVYDIVDRLILPLGIVAAAAGVVTYGGIFVSGPTIYRPYSMT